MVRLRLPLLLVAIGLGLFTVSRPVAAEPCIVRSSEAAAVAPNSLPMLLRRVMEQGECLTKEATLREEYKPYLAMAQEYHLIRWQQSMDIRLTEPLPALHGHDGRPLVLRADPDVQVRLIGGDIASTVTINGGGGLVIIDGVTFTGFTGTAITILSDGNTLLRDRVVDSGASASGNSPLSGQPAIAVRGRDNHLVSIVVTGNHGPGVVITEAPAPGVCPSTLQQYPGEGTQILQSEVADNQGDGIVINAYRTTVSEGLVHDNTGYGIWLRTESIASDCAEQAHQPIPEAAWHTAIIQRNRFWGNGGDDHAAIFVTRHPLVAPVDLLVVSPAVSDVMVLVGNISRSTDPDYPWRDGRLNLAALRVEIYQADGSASGEGQQFLIATTSIDPITRQFTVHIPWPIFVDGVAVNAPVFTALVVDTENTNTSPFAAPLDVGKAVDGDRDGIPNAQEDLNHDGFVDVGETDPRLADSDGDGLTDGEERLQTGLNPRNPDSDGDCLPDGLEMGLSDALWPPWDPVGGSVLVRPRIQLSSVCEAILGRHGVFTLANAIPWEASKPTTIDNIAAMYDIDPTTRTDPTHSDTDRDGVTDGAEDWNLDGARTATALTEPPPIPVAPVSAVKVAALLIDAPRLAIGPAWVETDPTLADSDGDGLLDGEEGDRNNSGTLETTESDPLHHDTDSDGVEDAIELHKFGSQPNHCDSDADGLGDGVEAGVMNPHPVRKECLGLQTAGSNFIAIGALQLLNPDSDNDGLSDGKEDENHNGWLDPLETDPTTADSDSDGIGDAVEMSGDVDGDGISDIDLSRLANGPKCSPPPTMTDVDCDGVPNARDDDADNDGCSDRDEGLDPHGDLHGVPAAFNAKVKACGVTKSSGGGIGGSPSTSAPAGGAPAVSAETLYFSRQMSGGGGCSLIRSRRKPRA